MPSEWLEIGEKLGTGEYGEVYCGVLKLPTGKRLRVAVKTLKEEMNEWAKTELLREARFMMELENEYIVKLIGVSWEPKISMVGILQTTF